jgi:hypothetical protein
MRTRPWIVAATMSIAIVACDADSPTRPTMVATVAIDGTTSFSALNQLHQLTATAQLDNGASRDVSAEAIWQSTAIHIVTVSATGQASSTGFGTATISASFRGAAGSRFASVSPGAGNYRLGIVASAACAQLPGWARHREYDAAIGEMRTRLAVTLDPGHTLQFPASVQETYVKFEFPPGHLDAYGDLSGPIFGSQVDSTSSFGVVGTASATLNGPTIEGQLSGRIWAASQTAFADCERPDHKFTLVPR